MAATACTTGRLATLSLAAAPSSTTCAPVRASASVSLRSCFVGARLQGIGCRSVVMPLARRPVLVRGAAVPATKKPDQAAKRARQAEKSRVYNKAKKSEVHTRMKKVFLALEGLKKKTDASEDDIKPVESLIAEAFSIIDKAVKVGTIHRNKGGHQKSRLSRAKKALEIQLGLYTPVAAA